MTRVGILGADIVHALEYASVITPPPDAEGPMLHVPPLDPRMEDRVATLRCAAATEPARLWSREDTAREPALSDAHVTCWWGADRAAAEKMAARLGVTTVYDRPEDMLGQVDVVLVCTHDASDHHVLAMPFLREGIAAFVDKPFTDDHRHAAEMVQAARESGAVLFSSSPWKWSPVVQDLRASIDTVGPLRTVVASGPAPGDAFFYVTHSLELVQYVYGLGAEHVTCFEDPLHRSLVIGYPGGRIGVVNAMREIAWVRHLVAYGVDGYLEADVSNTHRDEGKVQMVVEFMRAVRSGHAPLPPDYAAEVTRILVAAELSARQGGRRVQLAELTEEEP